MQLSAERAGDTCTSKHSMTDHSMAAQSCQSLPLQLIWRLHVQGKKTSNKLHPKTGECSRDTSVRKVLTEDAPRMTLGALPGGLEPCQPRMHPDITACSRGLPGAVPPSTHATASSKES